MNKNALRHFSEKDPVLFALSRLVVLEDIAPRHSRYFFVSLCREIIGQQLSGRVADVIETRLRKLFPNGRITPQRVLSVKEDMLRETGMSWAKVGFIRDLAQKVIQKEVTLSRLPSLTDEEVIAELTKIKGIGPWTAEMFLIFALGRDDVFSTGDLGLKRAIQKAYKLTREPSVRKLESISLQWKPYRSWAARVLWKSLELPVSPTKK